MESENWLYATNWITHGWILSNNILSAKKKIQRHIRWNFGLKSILLEVDARQKLFYTKIEIFTFWKTETSEDKQ